MLRGLCRDHQVAEAYLSQLKVRTQRSGKSLQELTVTTKQLATRPLVCYLRTSSYMFANRMKGREVKQHLLMDGERFLNKALNEALKIEDVKAPARPPMRLWEVRGRAPMGTWLPLAELHGTGWPKCWKCEDVMSEVTVNSNITRRTI
jgi:hypothetical protein